MTSDTQHVSADGKYRIGNGEFKNQVALTEIGDRIISTVWLPYLDGSFETIQIAPGTANDARPVTNFTEADALTTHAEAVAALVERLTPAHRVGGSTVIEMPKEAITAADLWGGQIPRSNLEEALYEALPFIAKAIVAELAERNGKAVVELEKLAADAREDDAASRESFRLKGKIEGVKLSQSYNDGLIRELTND